MHFPFSVLKSNPAFIVWVGIAFYHREIKANNADFRKTQCFTIRTEHIYCWMIILLPVPGKNTEKIRAYLEARGLKERINETKIPYYLNHYYSVLNSKRF